MNFRQMLNRLISSKPKVEPPPPYTPGQEGQAVNDLKKIYTDYEQHLLPKVVKVLEKTMYQFEDYPSTIKEIKALERRLALNQKLLNNTKALGNKNFFQKNVWNLHARLDSEQSSVPDYKRLADIKADMKSSDPTVRKGAVKKAYLLINDLKDKTKHDKLQQSLMENDNIDRLLQVYEMSKTLENTKSDITDVQKLKGFKDIFENVGEKRIIGKKAKEIYKTEKGKIFLQTHSILTRAKEFFSIKSGIKTEPVATLEAPKIKEEKRFESEVKGLADLVEKFKGTLKESTKVSTDEEKYISRMAIQVLEEKPLDQESVSRVCAEIELYMDKNPGTSSSPNFSEKTKELVTTMLQHSDPKQVDQFKEGMANLEKPGAMEEWKGYGYDDTPSNHKPSR